MRKIAATILIILVAGIVFIAGKSYIEKQQWLDNIKGYDEWSIIEGDDYNGHIGDIVIGNKDAKVKIIEYADFQCSACAITYPYIHEVVKEYGDQVAYIYRTYAISYHPNATAAATAAVAAYKQGYFEEFSLKLFDKQEDWFYSEGQERDDQFQSYFEEATGGKGDIEKYKEDLKSKDIKDKIAVDHELANRVNLTGTPLIYINKEKYEVESTKESELKQNFKNRINAALENANK